MGLLDTIKSFFSTIFARDPEEAARRSQLKKLHVLLAEIRPPYFKPKQSLVLPGFAQALYSFAALLKPLAEIARATIASSDIRIAQKWFDYLIECRLPEEQRESRASFTYEALTLRLKSTLDAELEFEAIDRGFQSFIKSIDDLGPKIVNAELNELERFVDICRHDYERFLGLFDPRASLDSTEYRPDFGSIECEQAAPELMDLYYVLQGFAFSETLKANLGMLIERRSKSGDDESKRKKLDKLFVQLGKVLDTKLDERLILALLKATKEDPDLNPQMPRERKDFLAAYRQRVLQQFDRDRDRLRRERHENALAEDIKALFGDASIMEIEGYDDDGDEYLRRESTSSFVWIKPLRILKTYILITFEPFVKESIKKILVEGYFDNKIFQNNLANIIYQSERSSARLAEFETQMSGNGRVSMVAVRRYVEELKRGKDISSFLSRLVDSINIRAREIVEGETELLAMLGDALTDIVTDYRRGSPDLVTNIRALGGGRNKEIMGQIIAGRDKILVLVKIMRKFAIVRPNLTAGTVPRATGDPIARPLKDETVEPPRSEDSDHIEEL